MEYQIIIQPNNRSLDIAVSNNNITMDNIIQPNNRSLDIAVSNNNITMDIILKGKGGILNLSNSNNNTKEGFEVVNGAFIGNYTYLEYMAIHSNKLAKIIEEF